MIVERAASSAWLCCDRELDGLLQRDARRRLLRERGANEKEK